MPKLNANGVELYYELHGPEGAPLILGFLSKQAA
jgi:hypothetical protein